MSAMPDSQCLTGDLSNALLRDRAGLTQGMKLCIASSPFFHRTCCMPAAYDDEPRLLRGRRGRTLGQLHGIYSDPDQHYAARKRWGSTGPKFLSILDRSSKINDSDAFSCESRVMSRASLPAIACSQPYKRLEKRTGYEV